MYLLVNKVIVDQSELCFPSLPYFYHSFKLFFIFFLVMKNSWITIKSQKKDRSLKIVPLITNSAEWARKRASEATARDTRYKQSKSAIVGAVFHWTILFIYL